MRHFGASNHRLDLASCLRGAGYSEDFDSSAAYCNLRDGGFALRYRASTENNTREGIRIM